MVGKKLKNMAIDTGTFDFSAVKVIAVTTMYNDLFLPSYSEDLRRFVTENRKFPIF